MGRPSSWAQNEIDILLSNLFLEDIEISALIKTKNTEQIRGYRERNKINKIRGKQLTKEEIKEIIKIYPEYSNEHIEKMFNLTKNELTYIRCKYNLNKSDNRMQTVKIQNGSKTQSYWTKEKELYLIDLYNNSKCIEKTTSEFLNKYNMHTNNYVHRKIKEIFEDDFKNVKTLYIKNGSLPLEFSTYRKSLSSNGVVRGTYSKEFIILFFKYYLIKSNIKIEDLKEQSSVRDIVIKSKLNNQIKKHGMTCLDLLRSLNPKDGKKPWEYGLQVEDNYWDNKYNVYNFLNYSFGRMVSNKVIDSLSDSSLIPLQVIFKYGGYTLPKYALNKNVLNDYFIFNNLPIKSELYYNGFNFDSKEEMFIYKLLIKNNYNISKLSRKDKIYDKTYNRHYIPDFSFEINGDKAYIEYFGLYQNNIKKEYRVGYKDKTNRKIDFYKESNIKCISLFPEHLSEQKLIEIMQKEVAGYSGQN